jgi:flagellar biosynthesis/type III secretory pathway protein FliH
MNTSEPGAVPADARAHLFRRLGAALRPDAWKDMLSETEREQILAQVRESVRSEFREELSALKQAQDAQLRQLCTELGAELTRHAERESKALAQQAAALALTLAERIVRVEAQRDPQVLVQVLETALHKVEAGVRLTVTVHPEDAVFLQEHPELLARLRIQAIKSDRRIERGGCMVKAGRREWDATIASQLASLSGPIQECLALEQPEGD